MHKDTNPVVAFSGQTMAALFMVVVMPVFIRGSFFCHRHRRRRRQSTCASLENIHRTKGRFVQSNLRYIRSHHNNSGGFINLKFENLED